MSLLHTFIDLFVHLDTHLGAVITQYGPLTYVILFLIIFCETGLVATPFLPGDSLIFAAGAFAAKGYLHPAALFFLLWIAAVAGDIVNYTIGATLGKKAFSMNVWFLNQEHLQKTEEFYERQGKKTIIIARFMPIVRTFAPFVAGIGRMPYRSFLLYNVVGGFVWVVLFLFLGYFFGNLPWVAHNFTLVIMAIIVITVLPGLFSWFKSMMHKRKA